MTMILIYKEFTSSPLGETRPSLAGSLALAVTGVVRTQASTVLRVKSHVSVALVPGTGNINNLFHYLKYWGLGCVKW